MFEKHERTINYIMGLTILGMGLNQCLNNKKEEELRDVDRVMIEELASMYTNLQTIKNENESLHKTILDLSDTNTKVLALLKDQKPSQIKYITQSVTTLSPKEDKITIDLPEKYTYLLEDKIPVAEFSYKENKATFETYQLKFKQTMAIGEKKTNTLLQVSSSADDIWYDVPSEVRIVHTEEDTKYPFVQPNLTLGIGTTVSSDINTLIPNATIGLNTIHLAESINILSPTIGVGYQPNISLQLIEYNIGKPLPLIKDLWISAGPQINTSLQPGVSIGFHTSL